MIFGLGRKYKIIGKGSIFKGEIYRVTSIDPNGIVYGDSICDNPGLGGFLNVRLFNPTTTSPQEMDEYWVEVPDEPEPVKPEVEVESTGRLSLID